MLFCLCYWYGNITASEALNLGKKQFLRSNKIGNLLAGFLNYPGSLLLTDNSPCPYLSAKLLNLLGVISLPDKVFFPTLPRNYHPNQTIQLESMYNLSPYTPVISFTHKISRGKACFSMCNFEFLDFHQSRPLQKRPLTMKGKQIFAAGREFKSQI